MWCEPGQVRPCWRPSIRPAIMSTWAWSVYPMAFRFCVPPQNSTQFTGVLPLTPGYRLIAFSPDQKSSYTLQVIIPARIKFAPAPILPV